MPNSLSDWLLSLAPPIILSASAIYAGFVHWRGKRNRRRGVRPHGVPAVYERRQEFEERIVRHQMVAREAARIVAAESKRLSPLYEEPTGRPARH